MKDKKEPKNKPGADAPLTDEQIVEAMVGEPKLLNGPVHLAAYDPAWPSLYERLAKQIREALGDKVVRLEHVGSTAVSGLSAKPVIDMVLEVPDSADEPSYVPLLEKKGYVLKIREPHWYEHRMLKPRDVEANLHVFTAGCEEVARMVLFSNWLRTHPEDRLLYEETKRQLAARTWRYTQNYADAKSEVVQTILDRARGD